MAELSLVSQVVPGNGFGRKFSFWTVVSIGVVYVLFQTIVELVEKNSFDLTKFCSTCLVSNNIYNCHVSRMTSLVYHCRKKIVQADIINYLTL